MPNWVYNHLHIDGNKKDIVKIKEQLNRPFTKMGDTWDKETNEMKKVEVTYTNPIFAFWNIKAPTNLDTYFTTSDATTRDVADNWYNWNIENWGTKWDVGVSDVESYAETELQDEDETSLNYRFDTAWGVPEPVLRELSIQYPKLDFVLGYEEETGWGGEVEFKAGGVTVLNKYEWNCRNCDTNGEPPQYCEKCEDQPCPNCGYTHGTTCEEHSKESK